MASVEATDETMLCGTRNLKRGGDPINPKALKSVVARVQTGVGAAMTSFVHNEFMSYNEVGVWLE